MAFYALTYSIFTHCPRLPYYTTTIDHTIPIVRGFPSSASAFRLSDERFLLSVVLEPKKGFGLISERGTQIKRILLPSILPRLVCTQQQLYHNQLCLPQIEILSIRLFTFTYFSSKWIHT